MWKLYGNRRGARSRRLLAKCALVEDVVRLAYAHGKGCVVMHDSVDRVLWHCDAYVNPGEDIDGARQRVALMLEALLEEQQRAQR